MRKFVLVLVVLALIAGGAGVYLWQESRRDPVVEGLVPATARLFTDDGRLEADIRSAAFNGEGSELAVLGSAGVGLAEQGRVRPLVRGATNAVDLAWLASGRGVFVAEGPSSTGRLRAIGLEGQVLGDVSLDPPFVTGPGHGMTANQAGTLVAEVAIERPALGRERRRLAIVQLPGEGSEGGKVEMADPGGPENDVADPFFVADDTVLVTVTENVAGGSTYAGVYDVITKETRVVSGRGGGARAEGVLFGGDWLVYSTRQGTEPARLWALRAGGGQPLLLGRVPVGGEVLAVHPAGRQALVRLAPEADDTIPVVRVLELEGVPVSSG